MKKSVFVKLFLVHLFVVFSGCFNQIDEKTETGTENVEAVSEYERLAFIAISGDYNSSVSEMESALADFIRSSTNEADNSSRNLTTENPYIFTLSKQENISTVFNDVSDSSGRNITDENRESEIPVYFYEITTNTKQTYSSENEEKYIKNLAITTTDRRIGCVLAYIEDCTVADLYDETSGGPAAIFYANLPGYINKISEIWNNELTEEYLNSIRTDVQQRSVANDVVTSYKYGFKNWKKNSENENCIIDWRIAKCINQSNYKDIVFENLGFDLNGCGPTAAMQIQTYYRFPEKITIDVTDEDGVDYYDVSIWENFDNSYLIESNSYYNNFVIYKECKAKKEVASDIKKYINTNVDLTKELLTDYLASKVRDKKNESQKEENIYNKSRYSFRKFLRWKCDFAKYKEYETYLKKMTEQNVSIENIFLLASDNINTYNNDSKKYLNQTPKNWYNTYMGMCALMYQTVKGMNAWKDGNGTNALFVSLPQYLRNVGYICDDLCPYDFQKVKDSISLGRLVPIVGQTVAFTDSKGNFHDVIGHFWILDGYARFYCEYYEGKPENVLGSIESDYVHVNWGWSGIQNGYYLNGVFDSQYYPLRVSDKDVYSGTRAASNNNGTPEELEKKKSGLYKVGLRILPNLRPNR